MKKFFATMAFLMLALPFMASAQMINLGPTNVQVKGQLGTMYGGTGSVPSCHGANQALIYNDSLSPAQFQCATFSIGGGTVTQVSPTGSNSMFSLNVANQTTTPQISITLSDALNQIFVGTGAGTGGWVTLPSCSGGTNALTYNNSTQTFGCNSSAGGGTTTNALTFSTSTNTGITSFNGSVAGTIDYASVGAPSVTGTGATGTWAISLANSVTFTGSGGAGSGTVFNGGTTFAVDYHTVGAPSIGGVGAVGTWNISILGNAATATSFASAPSVCTLGQFAFGIGPTGNASCSSSNVTITLDSGSPISATTCGSTHTQALTGVRSTSAFDTGFGSNPTAVTGWGASGGLVVEIWPDASNDIFDWAVCNQSSLSITPGAMTLNVGVK